MITSQIRNHSATKPTMENSRSNSLLTLKCEQLFQMTKQLFTLTIGFIPISIKRLFRNFDCKPVSSEKLAQAISAIQGPGQKDPGGWT